MTDAAPPRLGVWRGWAMRRVLEAMVYLVVASAWDYATLGRPAAGYSLGDLKFPLLLIVFWSISLFYLPTSAVFVWASRRLARGTQRLFESLAFFVHAVIALWGLYRRPPWETLITDYSAPALTGLIAVAMFHVAMLLFAGLRALRDRL